MKNNWLIFARKITALEKQFQPKLIRIIKEYRKEFIADLQHHGQSTAIGNLQMKPVHPQLAMLVQSIYKTSGLMGAKLTNAELGALKKEQKGFGRNDQWIADVINYLKIHMLGFVQDITETMRNDILNILQKGIDEQLSLNEIIYNLKSEGLIEARASVIARTEIVRAANVGHSVAAKSFPYEVNKKWVSAKDHRTRHSHQLANGKIIDENEYFEVKVYKGDKPTGQTDQMLYPGDANAHPSNTINCRCRITHIPKRDSRGNLIFRDQSQAQVIPMRRIPTYDPAQIAATLKSNITVDIEK